MAGREQTAVGVGTDRAPKQQDEGLGLVDLVVHPAAGLLHAEGAPLVFGEETLLGHLLEDVLGKEHVAILVDIVLVLLGVLDLFWKMWHSKELL